MSRPVIKRLCMAVCVVSLVLNMYLLLHIRLVSTSASTQSESSPLFFTSPSSLAGGSPISLLSSESSVSSRLTSLTLSLTSQSPLSKSSPSQSSSSHISQPQSFPAQSSQLSQSTSLLQSLQSSPSQTPSPPPLQSPPQFKASPSETTHSHLQSSKQSSSSQSQSKSSSQSQSSLSQSSSSQSSPAQSSHGLAPSASQSSASQSLPAQVSQASSQSSTPPSQLSPSQSSLSQSSSQSSPSQSSPAQSSTSQISQASSQSSTPPFQLSPSQSSPTKASSAHSSHALSPSASQSSASQSSPAQSSHALSPSPSQSPAQSSSQSSPSLFVPSWKSSSLQPAPFVSSLAPSPPVSTTDSTASDSSNNFTRVLCHRFTGRLGNELFQYASTLGLALTLNRTPVFLGSQHLPYVLKTFNQTSENSSRFAHRCQKAKGASEESCCKFDEKFTRLDPSQDFTVGTYLVSYKYFEHHETEIRKALTFTDEIRNESSQVVQELRQKHNASTLIGVHVRRGDMTSGRNIKLGYPQVSPDYLNRSMAFFLSLYPDCVFVVGSNSLQWCKDNVPSGYHVHYLTGHSPAVDMSVMSFMDHTIITFWSFSWWVGFFNAGTTVQMKDFIVNGTHIGRQLDGSSFTYPGWVPL